MLGKLLAAWIAGLGFLIATTPFLLAASAMGGLRIEVVLIGILVLVLEIGVTAAIGVGLSGLLRSPVFSIVTTYLLVALLGVGTLIAFGIGSLTVQETRTVSNPVVEYRDDGSVVCELQGEVEVTLPRSDAVWWILAANPFVVMADAIPGRYDDQGIPQDLFAGISSLVHAAQLPPDWPSCEQTLGTTDMAMPTTGTPSWFVGLALHVLLGGGLVAGAIARTRAPVRRLAPGSRIA